MFDERKWRYGSKKRGTLSTTIAQGTGLLSLPPHTTRTAQTLQKCVHPLKEAIDFIRNHPELNRPGIFDICAYRST
jgi:hypothetical protein